MDETVDLKALYELNKSELEKVGASFKEFSEHYKELKTTVETQKAEIDEIKTTLNRPPISEQKDKVSHEMKAMGEYLRGGFDAVTEQKALYRTDLQSGGILAASEWVNELIRNVVDLSPMRGLVRTRGTSRYSVQVPKYTGSGPTAVWINEKGTKAETPIATPFGMEQVFTHETYALVDVSQQDIEDVDFNLEQFIQQEIALQFALQEGYVILFGTGVGQPFGILDASSGIESYETEGSNAITTNDVMNLYFKLKPQYLGGARWVMNRAIVKTIAQIKAVADGQYMWQPGLQNGMEAPLLGKQIVEAPDMSGTMADADKAILFGDFNQAYWLIDRKATEIVRDPLTQATSGLVRYIARRRIGGRVVKPEALKVMTIKA